MEKHGKKKEKEILKLPKLIMKDEKKSNQENDNRNKNELKDSYSNYGNPLNKKRGRESLEIIKEKKEDIYEEEEEYDDEEEEEYDEEEEDEKTEKNNNEKITIKMKEEKNENKEKINVNILPHLEQKNNGPNKEKDKNENQEKEEIKDVEKKEEKIEEKDNKENQKDNSKNTNNPNNIEKTENNNDKENNNNNNKSSKRISFKEAQQSIKEYMAFLLETEEKIKSKYGNCIPDFTLEEQLPMDWQKKLISNFFQSEEMNNIANKINEEKNIK